MIRGRRLVLAAVGVSVGLAVAAGTPAYASDDSSSVPDELEVESPATVQEIDDSLRIAPAPGSGIGEVAITGGSVDVPTSPEESVIFSGVDAEALRSELPGAPSAEETVPLAGGAVRYPGEDFSGSLLVGERGIQVLTTIVDRQSPTEYSSEVSLEPGQHHEVESWTLTTGIDHAPTQGVAYSVVADPIWLAPWVVRCPFGIGLDGPQIARIASAGSVGSILPSFVYGAFRCAPGR